MSNPISQSVSLRLPVHLADKGPAWVRKEMAKWHRNAPRWEPGPRVRPKTRTVCWKLDWVAYVAMMDMADDMSSRGDRLPWSATQFMIAILNKAYEEECGQ